MFGYILFHHRIFTILTEIIVNWCHRGLALEQHCVHIKKKRHTSEVKVQVITLKKK